MRVNGPFKEICNLQDHKELHTLDFTLFSSKLRYLSPTLMALPGSAQHGLNKGLCIKVKELQRPVGVFRVPQASPLPAVSHDTHPNPRFIQMRFSARWESTSGCVGFLTWTSTMSWKSITHTLTRSHVHTNNLRCTAEVRCSVRITISHSGGQSAFFCVQSAGELQGFSALYCIYSRSAQHHVSGLIR